MCASSRDAVNPSERRAGVRLILAVAKAPTDPQALATAAAATGLALADVRRRLAGTLPRILLADTDDDRIATVAAVLEAAGFGVLTCDPTQVPRDDDRVVARTLEFRPGALVATDGAGRAHECPAAAIDLLQRGVRIETTSETTKTSERKLALGRAVLSGGLVLTKKVEKTQTRVHESRESFVLVQRGDGEPDVILYERRLDYRFLGAEMQPASFGNLERVVARLRALAPAAQLDDRVARPGFVSGLLATSADPVDLALFLVTLAHLRGWSPRRSHAG